MMRIGLLGYGVVGGGVDLMAAGRSDVEVARVLVRRTIEELGQRAVFSIEDILSDNSIDTVVEVMGGIHPAYEYVSAAIRAGKNVVTANKALVAACYDELSTLAAQYGVAFRCTAAVGGGIPWLCNLERCRRLDEIVALRGIMNGTTNYILHKMTEEDVDFAKTLETAQQLGYAEADPTADIDGWDIRRKLLISANIAFDVSLHEEEIPMFGIRSLRAEDIRAFRAMGRICKLIAYAEPTGRDIAAWVEPVLLLPGELETAVSENNNLILYTGRQIGVQSFFGQGAGRYPTAYNVLGDCLDILAGKSAFYTNTARAANVDNGNIFHRYYVRCNTTDEFLRSVTDSVGDGYILTKETSVSQMHAWAAGQIQAGAALFIAALR